MRVFGTVFPFVGFREEPLSEELRKFLDLPEDQKTINTFQFEWFGVSVVMPLAVKEDKKR